MKKTLFATAAMLILTIFTYAEVKIGIFDSQKLIEGTKKGRAVAAKLEKLGKEKQERLNVLQNQVKKLEKELVSPALNQNTRESKKLELQNKRTALKRLAEDSRREMQIQYDKEMNTLKAEVWPILQDYGKDKGLTTIFEKSVVLYSDPAVDITADIIKILDSK